MALVTSLMGFLGIAVGLLICFVLGWLEDRMMTKEAKPPRRYLHLYRADGALQMVTIETHYRTYAKPRPFIVETVLWTRPDGLTYEGELWTSGNINDW